MSLIRVSKSNPCVVCGKPSWCMVSDDGLRSLCMRAASERPFTMKDGSIGYWHGGDAERKPMPVRHAAPKVEHMTSDAVEQMLSKAQKETNGRLGELAESLGVRCSALMELRVAWFRQHNAFGFPMRDGNGNLIGIRLRASDGSKWSVTGSRNGLFYPYCTPEKELWIAEGGTDTAALRSLNLFAVGRPSCSGGMLELKTLVTRLDIRRAYILADNDKPGLDGAESLSRNLQIPTCIMCLPCKDVRQFVQSGGDGEMLEDMSKSMVWVNHRT